MYFEERLYADAARAFETMLAQSPGNFDALYNLGLVEYRCQRAECLVDGLVRQGSKGPTRPRIAERRACLSRGSDVRVLGVDVTAND